MSFNEVKLIIGIEDPRLADRRERFGIEDESGCSAEEKIQVLEDVDEGRVPTDIVAREFVLNELREWPGLDSDIELPENEKLDRRDTRRLPWTRLELKDERETRRECWTIIWRKTINRRKRIYLDFCIFTPYPRLRFSSRFSRWGSCLSTLCNNILYIMNTLQIILLWTKMSYFPTLSPSSSFARRPKSVKQREQGQSP